MVRALSYAASRAMLSFRWIVRIVLLIVAVLALLSFPDPDGHP
jgi:hypothetical protein